MRRLLFLLVVVIVAAQTATGGARAGPRQRGLWIGPLHICSDTVISVDSGTDRADWSTVTIVLQPRRRAMLERETARRVGQVMAVQVNGHTISTPRVMEPLTQGAVTVTLPNSAHAARVRASALGRC